MTPGREGQCRFPTWGGGLADFWVHGPNIGVRWLKLPDWAEHTPRYQSREWHVGSEATARYYLALLLSQGAVSVERKP